jgi:hypothetical protein
MNLLQWLGLGVIGGLLLYQLWISAVIFRASEYDSQQRMLQCLIVWLIPVIGAIGCHFFLRNSRGQVKREDFRFVPQPPNDAGPMD